MLSPLGRRAICRRYLNLAESRREQGDCETALRFANLAVHFDPENNDAIVLRDSLAGGSKSGAVTSAADIGGTRPPRCLAPIANGPEVSDWMLDDLKRGGPPGPLACRSLAGHSAASLRSRSAGHRARHRSTEAIAMKIENRLLIILLLSFTSGCSLLPTDKSTTFHQHLASRDDANSQKMADRRDQAEFMVAHQRMEQQDYPGCKEQLDSLLARNPKHCAARLLMADLLLRTKQPQAALAQVQEAIKYHADDADVQYAMGLTLDVNGRADEALGFYERATRAVPGNEAYALSYRTACEAAKQRRLPPTLPRSLPAPSANAAMPRAVPSTPPIAQYDMPAKPAPTVTTASFDSDEGVAYAQPDNRGFLQPPPSSLLAVDVPSPQNSQNAITFAADALKRHDDAAQGGGHVLLPAAQRFPDSAAIFRGPRRVTPFMHGGPACRAKGPGTIAFVGQVKCPILFFDGLHYDEARAT